MTKKTASLIVTLIVLAGLYLYYFTDWINPPHIQISAASRPVATVRPNWKVYPVTFALDGKYELTSVKVAAVAALQTNKHAKPLWHLVSKSNSVPTRGFAYGQPIRGMKPFLEGARPQPLEPGAPYRLLVEAGRARGQVDFVPVPLVKAAN
ncbi:MAG: hypothetical protein HYY24_07845 [Verrucomicrobia bacterium]|nr:hypothetical protein [Verrucomicrobiota bacterium]